MNSEGRHRIKYFEQNLKFGIINLVTEIYVQNYYGIG